MSETDPASSSQRIADANACFEREDAATAEVLLREVLAREPARVDAGLLLMRILQSRGRLDAACAALLALCEASDFALDLSVRCATLAQSCDRHAIAARICAGALAKGPVSPRLWFLAGNVARERGEFEQARAHYQAALAAGIDLERHHVLNALANTRRYLDPADPELALFARHFADTRATPRTRASAGFALAKARNDLGDYAAAAAAWRTANTLVHGAWPWDAAGFHREVAGAQHEVIAPAGAGVDGAFIPVFIVGVPRSGTTLTATLLARTAGVRDRGELRTLRYVAAQLRAGNHLGEAAAVAEAAQLYRLLAVQDDAPATWYLDQDPTNFRYLALAAAMFPQARIIHLRRDRRDTALSLWSQDFAHPDLACAYDFDDMAAYMAGHDALMRHWRRAQPLAIFELDYEALVADPERILAQLRHFIGAPAANPGGPGAAAPVQSASVWQARQPVYATSVGRFRHYLPYVPELARFAPAA